MVPLIWTLPNPADYSLDPNHFCLLARIQTSGVSPFGMTYPETSDVNFNTRNNAKIAWKNVQVGTLGMGPIIVNVHNVASEQASIRLAFGVSKTGQSAKTFLDHGTVDIALGPDLYARWVRTGSSGRGIKVQPNQLIRLLDANAWIGGIPMAGGEQKTITAVATIGSTPPDTRQVDLNVLQYSSIRGREQLVGGLQFNLMVASATEVRTPVITLAPAVQNGGRIQVASPSFLMDASQSKDPNGLPLACSWSSNQGEPQAESCYRDVRVDHVRQRPGRLRDHANGAE